MIECSCDRLSLTTWVGDNAVVRLSALRHSLSIQKPYWLYIVYVVGEARRVFFARFLALPSGGGAVFLLDVGWGHYN